MVSFLQQKPRCGDKRREPANLASPETSPTHPSHMEHPCLKLERQGPVELQTTAASLDKTAAGEHRNP